MVFSAYFSQRDYNIITVDYYSIATSLKCYHTITHNMPIIGKCTTQFLVAILEEHFQFTYLHAIGFSAGAQAIGLIGKLLKEKNFLLDRATGQLKSFPKLYTLMYLSANVF